MERISKFNFDYFEEDFGCYRFFAVSKQKYTKEEAYEIFEQETGCIPEHCKIPDCAVVWRSGISDGKCRVCWWLELDADGTEPRHCPVWAFEY